MKNLSQYYATQPPAWQEYKALEAEAAERGVPLAQVAREHLEAARERRQADAERVQAILADPVAMRRIRAQWAGETPPPEPPQAAPRDPNAPPSAGRNINPPRRR
jgi:hypothetical protein